MFAVEFDAMGCQMQAIAQPLIVCEDAVQQALANVPVDFQIAEQQFSRFLVDSELMQLNQQRSLRVSEPMWKMICHSLASAKLTNGLVSPTILPMLLARGYRNSFNTINNDIKKLQTDVLPTISSAKNTLQLWQSIEMQESDKRIILHDEVLLDLGGFAKGLTALNVAQDISRVGAAVLIDAGGDIVSIANSDINQSQTKDFADWQITLPSAIEMDLPLTELTLANRSTLPKNWQQISQPIDIILPQKSMMLATSGIDYRHWYQQGKWQTHLVNLMDNVPSNIVCASVLVDLDGFKSAKNAHPALDAFMHSSNACNLAQTLSKLCCLLGTHASLIWLEKHPLPAVGLSLIVATPAGFEQWINPTMQQFLCDGTHHLQL